MTGGPPGAGLVADAVTVRRGGRALVDSVSFALEPGSLTMLIGPNGAGKSTLLRMLAGSLPPDAGRVLLDGEPVARLRAVQLARRRAVVPQSMEVAFRFRAEEIVELGLGERAGAGGGERVRQAMHLTDCAGLAGRTYPELSGGEKARVQLARALAQLGVGADACARSCEARYLLLDEPVAALDPGQQHRMLRLLRELVSSSALGVLVTMHDLNLASQYADRVWLLEQGRMVAAGAAGQVIGKTWIEPVFDVGLMRLTAAAGCQRPPVATVLWPRSPRPGGE